MAEATVLEARARDGTARSDGATAADTAVECRDLVKAKALLEDAGARILGVVINSMPPSAVAYSYKRYYHSYMRRETR